MVRILANKPMSLWAASIATDYTKHELAACPTATSHGEEEEEEDDDEGAKSLGHDYNGPIVRAYVAT